MRAVVLNGARDVSVEEVPDAVVPGPDGLLLKVERTAICGSDLHLYHGPMTIPGVHLGHEFVGTVEDVGAGVRTVAKGDRVLVSRSEEHTSELQSLMRISYDVFCLKKKNQHTQPQTR